MTSPVHPPAVPAGRASAGSPAAERRSDWRSRADGQPGAHRLVQVESPYAGDLGANVAYARAAMADCLRRGEAPFASHLLYTQPGVLRDDDPEERRLGIAAGLAFLRVVDAAVVYTDRGITPGMEQGIKAATDRGLPVEYRRLGPRDGVPR